jgi:hypothetical protein
MHRREFLLSATGIVGATTVGSLAYTSATVTRSVSASVSDDASAVIGLDPNASVSGVTTNNGKLTIDVSSGLNQDGTFEYGDYSDPSSTHAFTITNNDTQEHDVTVGVNETQGSLNLQLDGPGGTVNEVTDSSSQTYTLAATDTIEAAVRIDTSGVGSGGSVDATMTFDAE